MTILPKRALVKLKRAASVFAIALATSGAANAAFGLMPAPALPVSTMQDPRKLRIAGGLGSTTEAALLDGPTIA